MMEAYKEDPPELRAMKIEYASIRAVMNRLGPLELDFDLLVKRMQALAWMVRRYHEQKS